MEIIKPSHNEIYDQILEDLSFLDDSQAKEEAIAEVKRIIAEEEKDPTSKGKYWANIGKNHVYLKCLEYLDNPDPNKVLSKTGAKIRRLIAPLLIKIDRANLPMPHIVEGKEHLKDEQYIFTPSHEFKEDVDYTISAMDTQAYIVFGSLPQFYNSFDGLTAWAYGSIIVDRSNKESRHAAIPKAIKALSMDANLLIFPEGTWCKKSDVLINKVYPGFYDIALKYYEETGKIVKICPMAHLIINDTVYTKIGEPFDCTIYTREEAREVEREILSTLKYELMEEHSNLSIEKFRHLYNGKEQENYERFIKKIHDNQSFPRNEEEWREMIAYRESVVGFFDREVEDGIVWKDKGETSPEEAFAYLKQFKK